MSHSLVDKRETGIFKQNWFTSRKQELDTEIKNGFEIFKLDETTISSEINIDENWKNNLLFMIYVNITVGNVTIDFLPTTFKQLLINLLLYKKLFVGADNKENQKIEREFIRTMLKKGRNQNPKSVFNRPKNEVVSFKKVEPESLKVSGSPNPETERPKVRSQKLMVPEARESLNESKQQILEEMKSQQEKQKAIDKKKMQKMLDELQGYFSKFVLNLQMNIKTFSLKVNNNDNEEVVIIKYGNEEIVFDIDLVFKERTHIKVLGLEVESRHGFNVFMKLATSTLQART